MTFSHTLAQAVSREGQMVDAANLFILAVCIVFFVLIFGVMFVFLFKYRQRPDRMEAEEAPHHSNTLELTWTIIPTIITIAIFYMGITGWIEMNTHHEDSKEVQVTASSWKWEFYYPHHNVRTNVLYMIKDKPSMLNITSQTQDVIHSLYIPAMRVKKDAVPRLNNKLYVTPTKAGIYDLFCTEYCGDWHSKMWAKVVVAENEQAFEDMMLEEQRDLLAEMTPEEMKWWELYSQKIYHDKGKPDPAATELSDEDLQGYLDAIAENLPGLKARMEKEEKPWDKFVKTAHPLWYRGQQTYAMNCATCHSVDGSPNTGPTFKGLWSQALSGEGELVEFGEVNIEWAPGVTNLKQLYEAAEKAGISYDAKQYLYDSIRIPNMHLTKGYSGGMTAFPHYGPLQMDPLIQLFQVHDEKTDWLNPENKAALEKAIEAAKAAAANKAE